MVWSGARKRAQIEREFMAHVFVHAEGLYRYALRLTGQPQSAEDLVQDALARAFDAFERLRPNTNHRAWVFTILRNAFISTQRRLGREQELEDPTILPDDDAPTALDRLAHAGDGYRHGFEDEVLAALQALSEQQRTAVVLCDVEGMSYEDIAAVMACPVGTVRSRIHHARRRLREVLDAYARGKGYGRLDEAV